MSVGVLYEHISVYLCVSVYMGLTASVGELYECVSVYLCVCFGVRL